MFKKMSSLVYTRDERPDSYKKKQRIILFFAIVVFGGLSLQDYRISIPSFLQHKLIDNYIGIQDSKLKVRMLPVPHLYADQIKVNIDYDIEMRISGISGYFSLWDLIIHNRQQLSSIEIEKFFMRVLDVEAPEGFAVTDYDLQKIINLTEKLIIIIPDQFKLANSLLVEYGEIYIDHIDTEKPFITATEMFLNHSTDIEDKAVVTGHATIGDWLHSNIKADIWLNQKQQSVKNKKQHYVSRIDFFLENLMKFEHFSNTFNNEKFDLSGTVTANQFLTLSFPLQRVFFTTAARVKTFSMKNPSGRPVIHITEAYDTSLNFAAEADFNKIETQSFEITSLNNKVKANLKFIYEDLSLSFDFNQGGHFALAHLTQVVSGLLPSKVVNRFQRYGGVLQPHFLNISPLKGSYDYGFFLKFSAPELTMGNSNEKPVFSGYFKGNDREIVSDRVTINGSYGQVLLRPLVFNLQPAYSVQFSMDMRLNMKQIWPTGNGILNAWGNYFCSVSLNHSVKQSFNCRQSPVNISTTNLIIPAGAAVRFLRLVSINIFSYWRSLKENSEIEINSIESKTYLQGDRVTIEQMLVETDTGNFNINGNIFFEEQFAKLTVKIMPLQVDKVLAPIPVVGKAINSTLGFAAEIILKLHIEKDDVTLESFTIGKGIQNLRDIFSDE